MPTPMKRALRITEVALYLVFMADCVILVVGEGRDPRYFPDGGVSLIAILVLIGVVQRLRGGKHYTDNYF